ncbi:hypothetical protein HPB52_017168 [Rhipicephalus sanguineus]|uniref:LIM zinc-binding domain-containing protein n=1 Tax=Rhipicephalus sanguineus TaxID=34632 RepID=A0A9D4T0V3_RHISA|nr:hypothetical protein HPB52_017168 [Rhipicephalus sanguineus]
MLSPRTPLRLLVEPAASISIKLHPPLVSRKAPLARSRTGSRARDPPVKLVLRPTAKISPSKADASSVGAMTEAVPQLCVSASDKAASGGGGCRGRRVCAGCGAPIRDQYILRVAPDLEWHAACLKCADCHEFLDETCTCFVRDGKTYCKRDYVRLFGTKCSKCRQAFCRTDFVMRARQHVYHLDCFRCQACERQLMPGDEFALREDGLFCRADHDVLDKFASSAHGAPPANGIHVAHNIRGNENTRRETRQGMSGQDDIQTNESLPETT